MERIKLNEKCSIEFLTDKIFFHLLMPALISLEPGGKTNLERGVAITEKFIYVLQGEVDFRVNKTAYRLKKDESFNFKGKFPHQFINRSKTQSKLLCIITPPAL